MGSRNTLTVLTALSLLASSQAAMAGASGALARHGCYERIYGAQHMNTHKGQFVTKVTVDIGPAQSEQLMDKKWGIVANADVRIWVKGHKKPFLTYGACSVKGGALDCGGSVSAAEDDQCKSSKPGVHGCRVDLADAGGFRVETRPKAVVISIPKRLELIPNNSDTGPYLNLVSSDGENSDFLLKPADGACD